MKEVSDKKIEREFTFKFVQVNFWSLHYLYLNLKEELGEIELENEEGKTWATNNRERELMNHFNKPNVEYEVRVREVTESKFKLYKCIFDRFSNYKHYLTMTCIQK